MAPFAPRHADSPPGATRRNFLSAEISLKPNANFARSGLSKTRDGMMPLLGCSRTGYGAVFRTLTRAAT